MQYCLIIKYKNRLYATIFWLIKGGEKESMVRGKIDESCPVLWLLTGLTCIFRFG